MGGGGCTKDFPCDCNISILSEQILLIGCSTIVPADRLIDCSTIVPADQLLVYRVGDGWEPLCKEQRVKKSFFFSLSISLILHLFLTLTLSISLTLYLYLSLSFVKGTVLFKIRRFFQKQNIFF